MTTMRSLRLKLGMLALVLVTAATLMLLLMAPAMVQQQLHAGPPSTKQDAWPKDFEEALQNPGKVTLYSMNPLKMNSLEERTNEGEALYRFKVLGKTTLSAEQAKEAIAEFKVAVTLWDGDWAKCFNPRHALRIEREGGKTYDLMLCYECGRMLAWEDGKYMFHYGVGGNSAKLDALLTAAGVPLPKKPGEGG